MRLSVRDANEFNRYFQDCELMRQELKLSYEVIETQKGAIYQRDTTVSVLRQMDAVKTEELARLTDELKTEKKSRRKEGVFSRLSTVAVAVLAVLLIVK